MKGIKKILISILIILMIGQFVQFFTEAFSLKPLHGVTVENRLPALSYDSWFSSDYQESIIQYVGDNFGFRSFFVRLNNQIYYSLFNMSINFGIVVGKENVLFEKDYIDSYYGDNFVGADSIDRTLEKLNIVNTFLENHNTELIILIAPNKANYYSAHIPTYLQRDKKITNYDYYVNKLDEHNFNVLDVNNWFLKIGSNYEYPLFTKTGIHWSHYAASLVADSLIRFTEQKINREMYHFEIDSLDFLFTREANTDYDLGDLMNTLFAVDDNVYGFPCSFKSIPNNDNYKPSMIVITDSFFWTLHRDYFSSCFYDVEYWYYFRTIHSWKYDKPLAPKETNVIKTIANTDVLLFLSTSKNLYDFGFGFIEYMYEFINLDTEQKREKQISYYLITIYENEELLEIINEKAIKKQISLDSMIYLDACWLANRELEKLFPKEVN